MSIKRVRGGQLGVSYKTKSQRITEAKTRLKELLASGASEDRVQLQVRYIQLVSRCKPKRM